MLKKKGSGWKVSCVHSFNWATFLSTPYLRFQTMAGERGRGLNLKGWDVKISIASISFLEMSSWTILGSLSQSITCQTERLFSLCLSTCCCSAQLTPAPSLFSVILSNSFYYLESIEWACQLKETLSPLTVLWSLIKEGSACQRCSANW